MAPPFLESDTTFNLSVNASDFRIPTVNVAVAPGFGWTSLLNSDDTHNNQADVVTETISTLSQVSDVLADSAQALSDARENLFDAGGRIGTQTVGDLKASNERILRSTKDLSETLNRLGADLSQQLDTTGSVIFSELERTSVAMRALLGDPNVSAPAVSVDGQSCAVNTQSTSDSLSAAGVLLDQSDHPTQETDTDLSNGIYGVISGLSARIDAYAHASAQCREELAGNVDALLGPVAPDASSCSQSGVSLSCQLTYMQEANKKISDQLTSASKYIVKALEEQKTADAVSDMEKLHDAMNRFSQSVDQLKDVSPGTDTAQLLKDISASVLTVKESVDIVRGYISLINAEAVNAKQENQQTLAQLNQVKMSLCIEAGLTVPQGQEEGDPQDVVGQDGDANGTTGHPEDDQEETSQPAQGELKLDADTVEKTIEMLSETQCPLREEESGKDLPPSKASQSLETMMKTQGKTLDSLLEKTTLVTNSEAEDAAGELDEALNTITTATVDIEAHAKQISQARETDLESVDQAIAGVEQSEELMNQAFLSADQLMKEIDQEKLHVQTDVANQYDSSVDTLQSAAEEHYQAELKNVNQARSDITEQMQNYFDQIGSDLLTTAEDMDSMGGLVIGQATNSAEQLNAEVKTTTTKQLDDDDAHIEGLVVRAVADSDAAGLLLSGDIAKVLADIGTNDASSSGLLGATAASNGQLGIADEKMSSATSDMSDFQTLQRAHLDEYLMQKSVFQASLARLENVSSFPATKDKGTGASKTEKTPVFGFRIETETAQ